MKCGIIIVINIYLISIIVKCIKMATVNIVLMTQGSSALVGRENMRMKMLAREIQSLYNEHGSNWINNYQPGDVVNLVAGDITNFQIAKIV